MEANGGRGSDCIGVAGNVGFGGGGTCTRALGFGEGEETRGEPGRE